MPPFACVVRRSVRSVLLGVSRHRRRCSTMRTRTRACLRLVIAVRRVAACDSHERAATSDDERFLSGIFTDSSSSSQQNKRAKKRRKSKSGRRCYRNNNRPYDQQFFKHEIKQ